MERAKDLRWTWSHCTNGGQHVFVENIFLGDASPTMIRAELYANGDQGRDFGRQEMTQVQTEAIGPAGYIYRATVPSTRPVSDSTVRIVPHCTDLSVPLEAAWILWRK
jgi:starch phosphorylase